MPHGPLAPPPASEGPAEVTERPAYPVRRFANPQRIAAIAAGSASTYRIEFRDYGDVGRVQSATGGGIQVIDAQRHEGGEA